MCLYIDGGMKCVLYSKYSSANKKDYNDNGEGYPDASRVLSDS
jgi:hypothetical protein